MARNLSGTATCRRLVAFLLTLPTLALSHYLPTSFVSPASQQKLDSRVPIPIWRRPLIESPTSLDLSAGDSRDSSSWDFSVAIVGGGPSGLLLAHRLLQSKLPLDRIDVYESRSDPREIQKSNLGGRAYALGLGIRGRTAIQSVDQGLWSAVKKRGFECERFRLHLNSKFNIKLRDREDGVEPSVLIYQTDLCSALLDELDRRADDADLGSLANVKVHFDSNITHVDLASSEISMTEGETKQIQKRAYDLIVGCDGANSIVRHALQTYSPPFSFVQRRLLPGCFKVARTGKMPPLMDPKSVGLILPESKSLGITAFVEPTFGGGAGILFAGKLPSSEAETATSESDDAEMNLGSILFPHPDLNNDDNLQPDIQQIKQLVIEQFPLLEGTPGLEDGVKQLLSQRTSVADSVKCNIYSSSSDVTATAICGDAAHATGGVSGQGCNSALMDSAMLANCLIQHYHPTSDLKDSIETTKRAMLHQCVTEYSQKAVPEGHALYDLSFGNDGKTLPIFRNIRATLSNGVDAIFGGRFGIGKKPLQTLLASSGTAFVEIRRDREKYYVEEFPSDECIRKKLEELYTTELVN